MAGQRHNAVAPPFSLSAGLCGRTSGTLGGVGARRPGLAARRGCCGCRRPGLAARRGRCGCRRPRLAARRGRSGCRRPGLAACRGRCGCRRHRAWGNARVPAGRAVWRRARRGTVATAFCRCGERGMTAPGGGLAFCPVGVTSTGVGARGIPCVETVRGGRVRRSVRPENGGSAPPFVRRAEGSRALFTPFLPPDLADGAAGAPIRCQSAKKVVISRG